jgi:UDP-glucose 6-dehydrogenase
VGDRVDEGGTQDVTFIRQALESIKNAKGTIILRSTIVPKTLSDLTFDYYIPEFLHEKFAIQECIRPYYYVRGSGTRKHDAWLPSVTELWQERAQKVFTGTYLEASHIKYFSNMWNALRIAFANELGDIVADSSKSSAPLEDAERVINFLFEGKSYLRYGRGFGGHCLPKDMRAFLAAYGDERNMAILSGAYESNRIHELRYQEGSYPDAP